MDDQIIRLVLQKLGFEGLDQLRADAAKLKGGLEALPEAYKKGEISASDLEKQSGKLAREFEAQTALLSRLEAAQASEARATDDAADATRSLVVTTDKATTAHHKLGESSEKAKGGMSGFGQSALQTGRIVQDFQAAGVMGIANNLEGLAMALGGGAGLAGALTIAATAYLVFKPQLVEFYNTLTGGSNKVPEAADALKRLEDRLKKVGDELDKLKEKQSLSNSELARFTELTKEQDAIEKQKEAAAAQKEATKKFEALKPGQQAADAKASAEGFSKAIAGRQEESIDALAEGLRLANQAAVTKAIARANVAEPGSEASRAALKDVKYYRDRSADDAEALEKNRSEVRDLMARIASEGKGADVSRAKSLMGFVPPEQRPAALSLGLDNATVEGREKIRKWIEDTEKSIKDLADDATMMAAEADKRAAANRAVDAAMAQNRELAKGPSVAEPPEPTRPAPVPRLVTPAQRRLAAAKQKRDAARQRKAIAKTTKDLGPSGGQMRAPKGFRSGVPISVTRGVKRAPTLDRPPVAPRPATAAETAAQAGRDAAKAAMIAKADADKAARRQSVQAAIDRAKAADAERRAHPRGPAGLMVGMGQPQGGGAGLGMLGGVMQKGNQLAAQGNMLDAGLLSIASVQGQRQQALAQQIGQLQQVMQRVMRDTNVSRPSMQRYGR